MITLNATKRSKTDKLESVRNNGMIPAVVYGARVENTSISVQSVPFIKVYREAGETSSIVLELEGQKIDVLIHDVQYDPIKNNVTHVDFLAIDMNKVIDVSVPLEFSGIAPAEKTGLGTLVKVLHEIEIQALPKDIPHSIIVDLSVLATLEDQIHASDVKLPQNVKLLTDGEEVIALVSAQKEETEDTVMDISSIEVEKKGKKEDTDSAE